jgi:hypothetical protein
MELRMTVILDAFNRAIPQPNAKAVAARNAVVAQSQAAPFGVIALDMRNPDHAEHLRQTFGGGALQSSYFPATNQIIDALTEQHTATNGPKPTTLFELVTQTAPTWIPAAKIAYCDVLPDNKTVVAGGVLTLVDAAQVSQMNLQIVDNNSDTVIANATPPSQFDRYTTQVTAQGVVTDPSLPINVTCVLTVVYTPVNGGTAITLVDTCLCNGTRPVGSVAVTNPNNNSHPTRDYIKIALNRTSAQQPDCDYWYTLGTNGGSTPIVGVQVTGSAILNNGVSLAPTPNFNGYLVLYRRQSLVGDGACLVFPAGDMTPYVTPSGTGFEWTIGPSMFANAPWDQNITVDLDFFMEFQLAGGGMGRIRVTSIPQTYVGDAPTNMGPINPLTFVWGCLAANTCILTPEGLRPIAEIQAGDQVISDASGTVLTVTDHWTGIEKSPMLLIQAADGREILVTDQHPMLTPNGVRMARELAAGDPICVADGTSSVRSIEQISYDGLVHNLDLGTDEERAALDRDATTMLADGFVVGDNRMQGQLAAHARASHLERDTSASLPHEWRLDFENSRRRAAGLALLKSLAHADH